MTRARNPFARSLGAQRQRQISPPAAAAPRASAQMFTFGDPEPVLNRREILDLLECRHNSRWYSPPINMSGLARTRWASPHHGSAMQVKINMVLAHYEPHRWLSREALEGVVLDFLAMGNAYLAETRNIGGGAMGLDRPLARFMRRGVEPGQFFQLKTDGGGRQDEYEFMRDRVLQIKAPDLSQEIYGVPEYLGALNSTFLNEAATIFRRRYFLNGTHAGFILYSTDQQIDQQDVDGLRQALRDSKGPGNFRNVFLHAPGGKKDGLQLIPVGEVAAKDEFMGIKNTSRDDILSAHRVPPQLLGIVPQTAGGFGSAAQAADVFWHQEIVPLLMRLEVINDWMGTQVLRWREYQPRAAGQGAG